MLFPEQGDDSGFDAILVHFDASAEVHLHSSLYPIHDVIKATPFNRSSFRQFEASSHKAAPKGPPSSFAQHRAARRVLDTIPSSNRTCGFPASGSPENPRQRVSHGLILRNLSPSRWRWS